MNARSASTPPRPEAIRHCWRGRSDILRQAKRPRSLAAPLATSAAISRCSMTKRPITKSGAAFSQSTSAIWREHPAGAVAGGRNVGAVMRKHLVGEISGAFVGIVGAFMIPPLEGRIEPVRVPPIVLVDHPVDQRLRQENRPAKEMRPGGGIGIERTHEGRLPVWSQIFDCCPP